VAASAPETTVPSRVTTLLLGVIVLGAVLLIIGEFLPLYEIRVVTAVPKGGHHSVGAHHLYANLLIGLALLPMAYGAVKGGSRPAAIACLVLALAALFIALAVDLPDLNETGLIGQTYDQAQARPRVGFFIETLGATLAVLGSIGALVLRER
jgi:dipeptide/tripeptide permease